MKQRLVSGAVLSIGLLLAVSSFALAQTPTTSTVATAKVTVYVYGKDGNVAPGETVKIVTRDGNSVANGTTDTNGVFTAMLPIDQGYIASASGQVRGDFNLTSDGYSLKFTIQRKITDPTPTTPPSAAIAPIVVLVEDATTKAPIVKAHVNVQSNNEGFDVDNGFTDTDGVFKTQGKANTDVAIVATAPGYFPNKARLSVTTEGKVTILLTPQKERRICIDAYQRLKKGDTDNNANNDVRDFQEKLREAGYLSTNATGVYGNLTDQAKRRAVEDNVLGPCYVQPAPSPIPVQPLPPATTISEATRRLNDLIDQVNNLMA